MIFTKTEKHQNKRLVYRLSTHFFCFGYELHVYCVFELLMKVADVRLQLKCDGTRSRTSGEVNGKLANGVGSQYSSHYLGTWCIQHYYR